MTPRRRARLFAVPAVALCAGLAATTAAPVVAAPSTPPARGLQLVQYAPSGAGWGARLLSSAPRLTTLSGPRAAADAAEGVQVAIRNPQSDLVWLDAASPGHFHAVDVTTVTGVGNLAGSPVPTVLPDGSNAVFAVDKSGHLFEFEQHADAFAFHPGLPRTAPWGVTDLTDLAGPAVTGSPAVVVQGSAVAVFARTSAGHLIEYVNQPLRTVPWRAYDVSAMAAGPTISSDPAAFYDTSTSQVRVAGTELAPAPGHLVVFSPTDVGGRVWAAQDVTAQTATQPLSGGVGAAVVAGVPVLFAPGATGDLLQFTGSDTATSTSWAVSDLTSSVSGAPEVTGTPAVATAGSLLLVAAVAAGWGDLFEWSEQGLGSIPTVADVSLGQGPSRTIAGAPAAAILGSQPVLFGAGLAVPPPEGTGVYAIPDSKLSQAIEDGWPALGVTGGLGTQCPPWVGYVTPPANGVVEPDAQVGLTIQQSHVRETWLSFWTISGPGTAAGQGCTQEKPPYTQATYYNHGYAAGRWVATQIDAYRGQSLALKPDWVIFDPEGYPDDHSGLDGPTSPPSALAKSIADWAAMLRGWKAGMAAVDATLRAAVYVDQYEYTTYGIYNQPLPVFIAGAFAEQTVGGRQQLEPPTRSAFGANILGFVMFNENFTPSCAQLDNEAQLLSQAPWNGNYNTVQTTPGAYCSPGPAAARARLARDR